jgi:hypothetical protein
MKSAANWNSSRFAKHLTVTITTTKFGIQLEDWLGFPLLAQLALRLWRNIFFTVAHACSYTDRMLGLTSTASSAKSIDTDKSTPLRPAVEVPPKQLPTLSSSIIILPPSLKIHHSALPRPIR